MSINFESIKTLADLKKANINDETIVAAVHAYFRNKEYHHKRNVRIASLVRKAKEAGL